MPNISVQYQEFIKKERLTQLTFHGVNDLYNHPLYGSYTIKDLIEKVDLYKSLPPKKIQPVVYDPADHCSPQLFMRHLRCVDDHGVGMFGD